jgi:hypothetical protein
MAYYVTTTFRADGKELLRGTILSNKEVKAWKNYHLLIEAGYIRLVAD